MNYFRNFYNTMNNIINPISPLQTYYSQNLQNKILIKNTFINSIPKDEFGIFKQPLYNSNKIKTNNVETIHKEELM